MNAITEQVKSKYAAVAGSGLHGDHAGVRSVAEAFGYTPEQLATIPQEAHMGLSCGNPLATANLQPGEVLVDLGSGGGIDVLLGSLKVGPTGKAIGIDMTPEMIGRAHKAAVKFGQGACPANVEFRLGQIEKLPLDDESVDCLTSNCVLNLVPDKAAAFREMYRVLKPGGRVAVSDIALKQPLPDELAQSVAAYVGCVAGALPMTRYETLLREAGFDAVHIVDTRKDLNVYAKIENQAGCCGSGSTPEGGGGSENPELLREMADLITRYDVNEYAASVQVYALKRRGDVSRPQSLKETAMKTVEVFDRPLCCSTGICGPSVDPALVHFAADLAWLKERGLEVRRYNLAHEPGAFTRHADVKEALQVGQVQCLPLIRIEGKIVSQGTYPSREQLAAWCGAESESAPAGIRQDCCTPSCCS
jgi:SAM-dependent methyltransferase